MAIDDPVAMFSALFERAAREGAEPDAMVLSTVDPDGRPSARYVLLKGVDEQGFVFYTNLESRKARALDANPYAARHSDEGIGCTRSRAPVMTPSVPSEPTNRRVRS